MSSFEYDVDKEGRICIFGDKTAIFTSERSGRRTPDEVKNSESVLLIQSLKEAINNIRNFITDAELKLTLKTIVLQPDRDKETVNSS